MGKSTKNMRRSSRAAKQLREDVNYGSGWSPDMRPASKAKQDAMDSRKVYSGALREPRPKNGPKEKGNSQINIHNKIYNRTAK